MDAAGFFIKPEKKSAPNYSDFLQMPMRFGINFEVSLVMSEALKASATDISGAFSEAAS